MVKHKASPKKGSRAGYAASIEPRVNDSTNDTTDTSISEPPPVVAKKSNLLKTKKSPQKKTSQAQPVKRKTQSVKVLKDIKKLQTTTNLLIPRAPFLRLIRELIQQRCGHKNLRITEMAVEAMREASECLLTSIFEDAYLLALHAKRVTLFPRDITLLLNLRHDYLSKSM